MCERYVALIAFYGDETWLFPALVKRQRPWSGVEGGGCQIEMVSKWNVLWIHVSNSYTSPVWRSNLSVANVPSGLKRTAKVCQAEMTPYASFAPRTRILKKWIDRIWGRKTTYQKRMNPVIPLSVCPFPFFFFISPSTHQSNPPSLLVRYYQPIWVKLQMDLDLYLQLPINDN